MHTPRELTSRNARRAASTQWPVVHLGFLVANELRRHAEKPRIRASDARRAAKSFGAVLDACYVWIAALRHGQSGSM